MQDADVLLVEDHPHAGPAMARLLGLSGYKVRVATCLADARPLASAGFPVAILDLMLPDGSGEELIDMIQAANADTRIFLWTAVPESPAVARIAEKSPVMIVTKPTFGIQTFLDLMPPPKSREPSH